MAAVAVIGQREGRTSPFADEEFLVRTVQALSMGREAGASRIERPCRAQSTDSGEVEGEGEGEEEEEQQSEESAESVGFLEHGCSHYRRRCRIRAPCCNEVFGCRHCHNEARSENEGMPKRKKCPDLAIQGKVESVICSLCLTEQEVRQMCKSCGVCMGEYFCPKCRFFDDDLSKGQFHCDECGICRTGGREKFFHCQKCGCCLTTALQNGHTCVEKSMHHDCPVCMEYLFDSRKLIEVLRCGHTIHNHCLQEMQKRSQFSCPICSKSTCDLSKYWELIDQEVAATPMPEGYRNRTVWILCNDCGVTGKVAFHIIGHKCANCNSYNTRQTSRGPSSQ